MTEGQKTTTANSGLVFKTLLSIVFIDILCNFLK